MTIRPTYANVASTLALVLALGGTGAYAAGLAKDSVSSKQIKNGAIKAVDIKKDAITGAQVKESTLGTVPSAAKLDGLTRVRITRPDTPYSDTPIFSRGPLSLSFFCDFAPTSGSIRLRTTTDDTAYAGDNIFDDDDFDADLDVADGYRSVVTAFGNGDAATLVDFTALAADGTSIKVWGIVVARNAACTADLQILG